jgi:methylmalonyl-CoA/ethylmalonyl-CoA epimerase
MVSSLISHLGIAVADLEASISRYELLTGRRVDIIEEVADQKVRVAMFSASPGSSRIELIAATGPDSPISKFIARHGEGLHHVCVYVEDIEMKLKELKLAGVKLIDESPKIGAEGKRIAFVHPSSMGGVLIELEERAST